MAETADKSFGCVRSPASILMCTSGNEYCLSLVTIFDLLQNRSDIAIFIDQQGLYAEPLKVIDCELLLDFRIFECIVAGKTGSLAFLENTVMITRLAVQANADAAQNVVEIGIGKTEAQKQKHLGH